MTGTKNKRFNLTLGGTEYKNCYFKKGEYYDGNTYLGIFRDDEDGDPVPVCDVTVNMGIKLDKNMAFIKSYSENEGLQESLVNEGFLTPAGKFMKSGYVVIELNTLNEKIMEYERD